MNKKAGLISKLVLFTLLVFFVQVFLFKDILTYYYPTEDEFALLVNSTPLFGDVDFGSWFSIGFAKYFTVYSEWTPYYQNILRPAVNIVYYINALIFGDNYGFYLLFSYLLNGVAFSMVYCISRKALRISENFSILAGMIFLLNPGLLGKFYFYPSFAFDLLAAVFAGAVLVLMLKRKYYWVLILLPLALFIKETMMFLPVAVFFTYLIIQKRFRKNVNYIIAGLYLLLPYIIWVVIRLINDFIFEGASYTDHFSSPKFFGITIVQSLLSWPLGIPDKIEVITNFKLAASLNFAEVNWFYLLASLFNLAMNVLIAVFTFLVIKWKQNRGMNMGFLVILTWLLIYYIMVIVLGLETRFGETLYLLGIPVALCISISGIRKVLKYSMVIYLVFIVIYGVYGHVSLLNEIDLYKARYARSKELVKQLKVAAKNSGQIFLVNDISAGFGYEWLPKFIGSDDKITKLNSLEIDDPYSLSKSGFAFETKSYNDTSEILVTLPDGMNFQFEGIDRSQIEHKEGEWFKRNEMLYYRFPEEKVTGISQSTGAMLYDFGNKMEVKYLGKVKTGVVYFNPSTGTYEFTILN